MVKNWVKSEIEKELYNMEEKPLSSLKIIWFYLKNYKKTVFITGIFAVVFAVFEAFVPYIYGNLVDAASGNSFSFFVFSLLFIWVLTTALSSIFKRTVSLRGEFIAIDVLSDSVIHLSSYVTKLPLSFHREKKVGEVVSSVTRAAEHLEGVISDTIFWIAPRFLTVFIGLTIMLFIDWRLALGTIIFFALSVLVAILRTPLLVKDQKILNKKFDESAGLLNDFLFNIQTIKSSGAEDFSESKTKKLYKSGVGPAYKKVSRGWENTEFLQEIIFSLGFVIVLSYAIFLLAKSEITQGTLIMFLGYLNLTRTPLRFILWQWISLQRGLAAIKRAWRFFDLEREKYNEKGKTIKNIKGMIEYKNVSFSYKERGEVLKNISFKVLPGEKIALVGGSGEGKSTTVDLLSLYFIPDKGKILLDGVDIKKLKLDFLRSIIAYVPQEIILFNDTIKNNILYGKPAASFEEIEKAARAAHISNFIEGLPQKYNTLVGERGIKLSAGQKQRLAIARAIIRNPRILVLDEATSSLDVKSERAIQEALENLIENKTTFIIAHRLSTVRKADKILVIESGKIVEQGTHKELMKKKGAYYKFYSLQFSNDS